MIFATDLDRTLIYSHLFLEQAQCEYELIEKKGDRPISYISSRGRKLLQQLGEKAHIVPITMRNREEFDRIDLFKEQSMPEIFVINNGGTIYYKGKEDREWTAYIETHMQKLNFSHPAIKALFLQSYLGKLEKVINCGQLVWLLMGKKEEDLDLEGIQKFRAKVRQEGWCVDKSGRKLYIYPYFVTKWQALQYIQHKYYKDETIVAAGDSIFDREMVEKADYGIIPKSCFIEKETQSHVKITSYEGIKAAEEILEYALEKTVQLSL